jgi:hypothetical protein
MAQTTIDSETTTPLATSTSGDISITSAGSVTVVDGAAAITVDSDNEVDSAGLVNVRDSAEGGTGILVDASAGDITTNISISGGIAADELLTIEDDDDDGDGDGPLASDTLRYGIRFVGPNSFVGELDHSAGTISVEGGAGSTAISVETNFVGDINIEGRLGARGDNTYGFRSTAPITGNITFGNLVQSQGGGATAIMIGDTVDGRVRIDGVITNSGYRYIALSEVPGDVADLDADDLLQGGPAVHVAANLTGGFVLDAPPPSPPDLDPDPDVLDRDGDGIHDPDDDFIDLDNDGTNDVDDDFIDLDADGENDTSESTGRIEMAGSAPALLIGSSSAVVLGNVGTEPVDQHGVMIRGRIIANGVYDGVSATGAQIGGLGGSVDTSGGVAVLGQINTAAVEANSYGLVIGDGAIVPQILLDGGLISAGAQTSEGIVVDAQALRIDSGAAVSTLDNDGIIRAGVNGPAGNATAVLDSAGLLATINNTRQIQATVIALETGTTATGDAIALDLRANTTGVALTQDENEDGADVFIRGDILFADGALNDTVTINSGFTEGAISFGGGADALSIDGTSIVRTSLTKGAGTLDVDIVDGRLSLTTAEAINVTSLDVGSAGTLSLTADPAAGGTGVTRLNVSGAATFAADSRVALEFTSKLTSSQTFTVLSAGSLIDSGLDSTLAESLPALYAGTLNVGANEISLDVRRRTASELNLFGGRAEAFEAFYQAFDADPGVANTILSKTSEAEFAEIYDQFLPDYSGGPFNVLANTTRSAMEAQAENPPSLAADEPRSWIQEVGLSLNQETADDIDYETGGFGFVGGIERPNSGGGYSGMSVAYMASEIRNGNRALGSNLSTSAVLGSFYWRRPMSDLVLDASLTGGVAFFDSERVIVDQDDDGTQFLSRTARADWSGGIAAARVGATYYGEYGRYYFQPSAALDVVYMREGDYVETGGGAAVNLALASRTNHEAAAEAGIRVGAQFGRAFRWGPELLVGYRAILSSGDGETTAAFASVPGSNFTLSGIGADSGRLVVRAALRGQGAYSNFALEAGGEFGDVYDAYMARLRIRFVF